MVKKIIYILFIFCAAITSAVNAQDVTRTTQIDENNGFRWVLVETSNGYGAETIDGKTIIPSIYNRINYVGNAGYRDYFIVEDRYLKKIKTGSEFADRYVGIYSSTGECIIPTTRGYSGIWGQKSEDSNQVFYVFEIHFDNVEIDGICDIHGTELWSSDTEGDRYSGIKYSKVKGFYYLDKKGEYKKLNIYLQSNDNKFNSYASGYQAADINNRIKQAKKQWIEVDGKKKKLHVESYGYRWYEVQNNNSLGQRMPMGELLFHQESLVGYGMTIAHI